MTDYDYGITPTFSEDESGVTPPPPPYDFRGSEPFSAPVSDLEFPTQDSMPYSDEILTDQERTERANAQFSDEPLNDLELADEAPDDLELRNDYAFEHTLSEHELKYGVYETPPEASDTSTGVDSEEEEDMKEIEEKRSSWMKRKLVLLCLLLFVLLLVFLGLTARWVNQSKAKKREQLAIAEANAARARTSAPTDSPTIAPTDAPSAAPTECEDEVSITKACYDFGESIDLTFRYCSPENKNWIGIYREGAANDEGKMNQRSFYWQLTCGGHGDSCETPLGSGNLTMTPSLGSGRYQVYGIGNMDRPYQFNSKSNSFIVRRNCEEWTKKNPTYGH